MNLISEILVVALGGLHIGIMGLEMFAKPATQAKSFGMPLEFVKQREAQTALRNQGIYNGMLGISLMLTLVLFSGAAQVMAARLLSCFVLAVGVYGGATATKKIWAIQALPAAIVLAALAL